MSRLLIVVNDQKSFLARRADIAIGAHHAGYEVHVLWPISADGAVKTETILEHSAHSIEELVANGVVTLHPVPMVRAHGGLIEEMSTLFAIRRVLKRVAPDIVHQFTIKPAVYGTIAARTLRRVPIVVNSFVGLGYLFTQPSWRVRALRRVLLGLYGLAARGRPVVSVFQNSANASIVTALSGLRPSMVRLTSGGSGVDLRRFPLAGAPPQPPTIILPARMLWDKGVGEFVEAARIVRAARPEVRFVLVGGMDGSNPAAIPRDTIQTWESDGTIEYHGFESSMPRMYAASTMVCLPSYAEGVPRSLLEAAAAGRPIVTTDVPGCRDVVRHGDNGLLVPVRDAAALARAIESLLADPAKARQMGLRGRARAESEFALDAVVESTLSLYGELLGSKEPRRQAMIAAPVT